MSGRLALLTLLAAGAAFGQSTQGMIAGRVVNFRNDDAVGEAAISWTNVTTGLNGKGRAGPAGYYTLAPLSPGTYTVRAEAPGYRAAEIQQLELAVAGRLDLDFQLHEQTKTTNSDNSV